MTHDGPTWSAWQECKRHWRAYVLACSAALLAAALLVVSTPKEYSAQVKIADEHKETDLLMGLNSYASWAKSAMTGHQGLRKPVAYHLLVMTRDFAEELSKTQVPGYGTDYYHYTLEHSETPWWKRLITHTPDSAELRDATISAINRRVRSKASTIYGTTVIQVTDNDPVVAAMMADSARVLLQRRMAAVARQTALYDLETALIENSQAEARYIAARDEYARYSDSHNDPLDGTASSEEDHLLKEYETAFAAYEKEQSQLLRARALVDKFSFTFTVLTNATVPQSPSSPAAIGYILSLQLIALTLTTWVVLGRRKYKELKTHSA